jgi:DNA-binding transcriptional MerR regulator
VTEPSTDRDDRGTHAWVTVSEAAERAGVDTGTVRHWYRSGQIPTQRSEGERGAFLVPLEAVLSLVGDRETVIDVAPSAGEIEVTYWSLQAEAATADAEAARREASQARQRLIATEEQLGFLRSQLAEASEEARNLREQLEAAAAQLQQTRSEVDRLRKEAAEAGSITDFAWLERAPTYESPVRPQERRPDAVSELFASVQKDPDSATVVADDVAESVLPGTEASEEVAGVSDEPDEPDEPTPAPEPDPPRPGYGYHDDDVFPNSPKRDR